MSEHASETTKKSRSRKAEGAAVAAVADALNGDSSEGTADPQVQAAPDPDVVTGVTEVAADAPSPDAPPLTWAQAVSEADAARIETEVVEEIIDITLSEADLADIARANAADDQDKTERQRKADDLRAELKEAKGAIDAIVARMHDRNNAVLKGTQSRKAKWIVESIFVTNTARYRDPITNRVVLERPLRIEERQVKLPLDPSPPKQMSLDDVAPADGDSMTDPEALLAAAMDGAPPDIALEHEDLDEGDEEPDDFDSEEDDA